MISSSNQHTSQIINRICVDVSTHLQESMFVEQDLLQCRLTVEYTNTVLLEHCFIFETFGV